MRPSIFVFEYTKMLAFGRFTAIIWNIKPQNFRSTKCREAKAKENDHYGQNRQTTQKDFILVQERIFNKFRLRRPKAASNDVLEKRYQGLYWIWFDNKSVRHRTQHRLLENPCQRHLICKSRQFEQYLPKRNVPKFELCEHQGARVHSEHPRKVGETTKAGREHLTLRPTKNNKNK